MVIPKGESPTPEEIEAINEAIDSRSGASIQDRDSYDLAYNDYMNYSEKELEEDNVLFNMREEVWEHFSMNHPDVAKERLFSKAKGRDLRRDRLKTARKVVTTRKQYIKGGASKLDLKGYDTARQRITKGIAQRRTFTVPSRIKGRVVFSIRTSVVVRGKSMVRYRDARGRFASAKVK